VIEERSAAILAGVVALCEPRGWRWRWRTHPSNDQWKAEVKILARQDGSVVVKAWFGATNLDEESALRSAVEYALEHITQQDRIEQRAREYRERIERGEEQPPPPRF
jgi:hypothetical protein